MHFSYYIQNTPQWIILIAIESLSKTNTLLAPFSIANSGSIYTTTYIVVSIAEKYFMYTLIFAQVLQ